MLVNLDTERLQELINLLRQANSNIDSAAQTLLSVTTHNGWGCKERYIINDYILENRKMAVALQQECDAFCAAAKSAADELVETENSISDMFGSVEAALAKILSNPVASVIIGGGVVGGGIASSGTIGSIISSAIGAGQGPVAGIPPQKKPSDVVGPAFEVINDWHHSAPVPICHTFDDPTTPTSLVDLDQLELILK